MCTITSTARPDDAIDLSRLDWDIVVVGDPERDLIAHYRVTCWDRETGTFIGEAIAPPAPGGGPPSVTVADIVELIGGYRLASIVVEIEAERLARINRRCADRERQRARGWLRRVPNSVLAEHGIAAPASRGSRP
jgi:aminoglycoside phosphotransferase (APT) family kinase protein